nr:MAG TPA: hypothetical protein [Caudoviricetes sp.]
MLLRRKATHLLVSVGHAVKRTRHDTENSPLCDDLLG